MQHSFHLHNTADGGQAMLEK